VSVTVGFSQATTPLLGPAPGTTRPDGTPADGSAEGVGDTGLFAALLAMLTPGSQPPTDTETTTDAAAQVGAPDTILPGELPAVAAAETQLRELTAPPQSADGKALLKDFADALKAAKAALDEGKPLDPALEKKLEDAAAALAAWFAGQPQLQPAPVDVAKLAELASGSSILPAAPAGDLPEIPAPTGAAPAPTDAAADPAAPAATNGDTVIEKVVQAQPVPAQLAALGDALTDFAAQLEKASPDLAKALAALADRISVGDVSDDAMAQLGLTRSLGSTSPELDQLLAALVTKPDANRATTPQSPIAAPVLDLPEVLATAAATAPEAKKTEVPQPEATRPEARASEPSRSEPLRQDADLELDTEVKLDSKPAKSDDRPAADAKPAAATPAHAAKPPDVPAPAPPAAAPAQAAATTAAAGTRAIHAAYAAPVQQLNLPQVAFEVARQFDVGNSRFQIRLDPPELGRIDVKLDLDKHGTVNARMFVERPETLDLMLRDQRALQQALQQAGLDTSKTNLEFSLRQNPYAGTGADTGQGGGNGGQPGFGPLGPPVPDESTELAAQTIYRGSASASGVNLFV
jgi:flagellar hook-length control protein FliK